MSPWRATTRFPPLTGAGPDGVADAGALEPGDAELGAATDAAGGAVAAPLHAAKAMAAAAIRAPVRKRNISWSLLLYRYQVQLARRPCHSLPGSGPIDPRMILRQPLGRRRPTAVRSAEGWLPWVASGRPGPPWPGRWPTQARARARPPPRR